MERGTRKMLRRNPARGPPLPAPETPASPIPIMSTQTETRAFEAEVQQVLSLVIHSLYSNREIFLRELISNASDALDKLRFEALTDATLLPEGETLGIALEVDGQAREIRIVDNGIGMSREELVANLGTIASSGTRRFLDAVAESGGDQAPELIGQFGVGFYSAFMVAGRVTVETLRAGEEAGWRWSSSGDGEYLIEPVDGAGRGTMVTLHLREEEGLDEFATEWKVREIVKRYSDFCEYPIQMEVTRTTPKLDDDGEPVADEMEEVTELETLNSRKPLWARPKDEITAEEHAEFYRHLTHDWNEPLEPIHFQVEGTLEYTALLYLPKERPLDLFDPSNKASSVSLYVKRVLIQKECEDLLPAWLRFVRGVVECNDLPLNVSRETLQDNPRIRQIRKRLVKKVLEVLGGILEGDRERYEAFWASFGLVLKEGIYYGEDEDQRISSITLFESTAGDGWTTLGEYVERSPEDQDAIYVIAGASRKTLEASPHLEAVLAKGYEVLFLLDPVDEWVIQRMPEFDGRPIRSIDKGEAGIEDEESKEAREKKEEEHKDLLTALQAALEADVREVRFSARLKESPAVLVDDEGGFSSRMERALRQGGRELPGRKRILELNPDHALVGGLKRLFDVDASSPRVGEYAELLLGQALITEGSPIEDPSRFARLLTDLMVERVSG